ncbi:unnamed protein product, partial [Rotaria sp. Silwood1]
FKTGVIYYLIRLQTTSTIQNSRIQHRSISITLVITTSLFIIMTIPATIDGFLYSYHVLSFPLYMITFDEFRQEFFAMITCKTNNQRVAAQTQTVTALNTLNTQP